MTAPCLRSSMTRGEKPTFLSDVPNPSIDDNYLVAFVRKHTATLDDAHGFEHALSVYRNAIVIAESDFPGYERDLLMYAAMLHELPESVPRVILEDFVYASLPPAKATAVLAIIEDVPISKEANGSRKHLDSPYDMYLDIVSDADRLESIGTEGLARLERTTAMCGGRVPQDVVRHCNEALLRLYEDGFVKTAMGRKLALPLHRDVQDYVRVHRE